MSMALNSIAYCGGEILSNFVASSSAASFLLSFLVVNKLKQELKRGLSVSIATHADPPAARINEWFIQVIHRRKLTSLSEAAFKKI